METLVIDGNVLLMSSVMVWRKRKYIPISYFLLLQVFRYVNQFKPDKVYIAVDGGGSWRKLIYPYYKANRKSFRESFPDVNWDAVFKEYDTLLQNLQRFTPFIVIKIEGLEGDDIISYICRYEKDAQIVIVSKDKDLKQLLVLPHVSLYLVKPKKKSEPIRSDDNNTVEQKIANGDVSDNIPKARSLEEAIRNEILVDLLNLPKTIDITIKRYLDNVKKDESLYSQFVDVYKYKFLQKYTNLITKGGEQ